MTGASVTEELPFLPPVQSHTNLTSQIFILTKLTRTRVRAERGSVPPWVQEGVESDALTGPLIRRFSGTNVIKATSVSNLFMESRIAITPSHECTH